MGKKQVTEATTLLAPQLGLDVSTLEEVLQRCPSNIEPINGKIIASQQEIADTFLDLKLIPKPI